MLAPLELKPLGQLLIGSGRLAPAQLDLALQQQHHCGSHKLLGEILVEQKMCSTEQVAEALAGSYGIPFARITPKLADPKVIGILPRAFLERNGILPLFKVDGVLTVAVPEPADVFLRDQIERLSGCRVQFVAAMARDIHATLQVYLPHDQTFVIDEILDELDPQRVLLVRPAGAPDCTDPVADSPPVVNLVRYSIYTAVREGATEMHFEPGEKDFRIRYRLDGRLAEKRRPPAALHGPVTHRLKWMAGLDLAETRKPQDGSMRIVIDGRPVMLSVSTMPGRHGEVTVLRIVEADRAPLHLEKLGFAYDSFKQWRKLLALPQGLVLVTGPAGAGRRTTLYASLRELNSAELNICTAEDPIQAGLAGTNQLQIDPDRGLDFVAAITAILRQSPDVLMISDIRDAHVARLAAQAALDGRLVLGSCGGADAPAAIAWLLNLGLEPYMLGASLAGVLAQRLVRKLCQACKQPYEPSAGEKRQLDRHNGPIDTLFRPKGCPRCRNLGYLGRIAIHELLIPDEHFRQRLSQGAPQAELRDLARAAKLKTLRADGLEKVRAGITTLDEVYRVTA